mgnify:CR=1 FL=1
MSNAPGDARRGLLSATRNGVATLLSAGRTRLELLGNEIREEKLRAVRLLLLSQVVAFCLMVGTIVAVATVIRRAKLRSRSLAAWKRDCS